MCIRDSDPPEKPREPDCAYETETSATINASAIVIAKTIVFFEFMGKVSLGKM